MSDYETYKMLTDVSNGNYYTTTTSVSEGVTIWFAIASILAIVGGILIYFLFIKSKNEPKGKFAKWFKDFLNFRIMILEPILKILYYILTIGVILISFGFLGYGGYGVLMFFLSLVLGPVLVRVGYEFTIMFVMIWRNTKDIADNTAKKK